MRTATVGVVAGLITGVVIGATVVAPYIVPPPQPVQSQESGAAEGVPEAPAESEESAPEPQIAWTVAASYPTSLPHLGTMAASFERRLWRVSDATFRIQLREPAAREKPTDHLRELSQGHVDGVFTTPALWASRPAVVQLFGATPFGMEARTFLAWMESGNGKALFGEVLAAEGASGVMCGAAAAQGAGWFRKPIRTAEDFRSLRMRIAGLGARVMERMGAVPMDAAGADVLAALDSGVLDAAAFSLPSIDTALQLQTLVRHYYFPGWQAPVTAFYLIVPTGRWNALSAIQRAQIEAVCGENVQHSLAEGDAVQFAALRKLAREGVDVRRWPPEVLDALRAAWNAVVDEESAKDATFRKVMASMRAFEGDHRVWRDLSAP